MRIAVALAVGLLGACLGDDVAPRARYVVGVSGPTAAVPIRVAVDGELLAVVPAALELDYRGLESPEEAPLMTLETRDGSDVLASIQIGFGACDRTCVDDPDDWCAGKRVTEERTGVSFDERGFFRGFADDPRAWRGDGALWCTFDDGSSFVIIT